MLGWGLGGWFCWEMIWGDWVGWQALFVGGAFRSLSRGRPLALLARLPAPRGAADHAPRARHGAVDHAPPTLLALPPARAPPGNAPVMVCCAPHRLCGSG